MNNQEGLKEVDTNSPFDAIDCALTLAMRILIYTLVGVAIGGTLAMIFVTR